MNARQRLRAALSGNDMDRIPMLEICFWPETIERWKGEGMPATYDPQKYFGLDGIAFFETDGSLMLPAFAESETETESIIHDANGLTMRAPKNRSATPSILSAALQEPGDWRRFRDRLVPAMSRMHPISHEPITGKPTGCADQLLYYQKCVQEDIFTVYTPVEPAWFYLRLMLEEDSLVGIAADPDGVERIVADYTRFNMDMLKLLYQNGLRFDAVWVFSDLCYKQGMLFSPAFYRERLLLYLKRYVDLCHEMGSFFIYHSDGNLEKLLPLLYEAGIDCMQPLEARAGNDVTRFVHQYEGRMSFMGNINADKLSGTRDDVISEVGQKVRAAKRHRRYIFHSDHSVPPSVSLENYRLALEIARAEGRYGGGV